MEPLPMVRKQCYCRDGHGPAVWTLAAGAVTLSQSQIVVDVERYESTKPPKATYAPRLQIILTT
ncbi:hypothetical protein SK128_022496, partial [Halocaridina rubra]